MISKGRSICVLVSGGLDSAVLLAELTRRYQRVVPVFVQLGLVWESVELYWLRRFLRQASLPHVQRLVVLDFPFRDLTRSHWSITGKGIPGSRSPNHAVYIPGRNIILLSKAAVFCALHKINAIAIGPLKGNPFPDSKPAFFRAISRTFSQGLHHPLRIIAPFRQLTKSQVVARGRQLPLALTFSCLAPRGRAHCGQCNKCTERRQAFHQAGISLHPVL